MLKLKIFYISSLYIFDVFMIKVPNKISNILKKPFLKYV